jgi:hypothetical protein
MERRERRVQLVGRPRTPEPMGLGMTHLSDGEGEDPHHQHHLHQLRRQRDSTSTGSGLMLDWRGLLSCSSSRRGARRG